MNDLRLKFSVAPMMDWTDRHCRVFHRLMTRRARLYTEMLTTGAIIHGDRQRLLGFDPSEHPVALQLGGSDAACARDRGEDRRGFRLRRNQSQCRLSVRPGEGRPVRRLPDGGAGAGRRRRCRDEARGENSRHRQMPDRHRRPGSGGRARCARARRDRGRRRRADRACPQGLAQRIVAEGKSRHPAARLRPGLSVEGGAAGCARYHQWRHRQHRGSQSNISIMSTA